MAEVAGVLARLEQALNAHDLEALVSCFGDEVLSEQPVHPSRAFRGRAQVEKNWEQLFAAFPDLSARTVRSTVEGNVVWVGWDWSAHRVDGANGDRRGVTILGVEGERIQWVRLYMEPVEQAGADIETAIRATVSS